jgi:predicted nucleic acid-binding protein
MRLHISLAEDLVAELDRRVGRRRRSAFIAETVGRALDDERRWDQIEAAIGALGGREHEWDDDPAAWVAAQRRGVEREWADGGEAARHDGPHRRVARASGRGAAQGAESGRALRVGATVPAVCAVNVEEPARGVRPGEEDAVAGLLVGLVVVRLGRTEGERAGRWRREFAIGGTSLSQADCLVAAAAMTAGLPLATEVQSAFPCWSSRSSTGR